MDIPVRAESPSAAVEPWILAVHNCVPVAWNPTRGWTCMVHLSQPCVDTAGLAPVKHPEWNQ